MFEYLASDMWLLYKVGKGKKVGEKLISSVPSSGFYVP